MSERSERTSRSGGSGKNFSFAVSQKVSPLGCTKSTKIVIFLNMHFNVSDAREGFFSYFLSTNIHKVHTGGIKVRDLTCNRVIWLKT